jgi:hypothetical protein
MKVDKTTWVVLYPNGVQARYKVTDRTAINGQTGTVASKFAGDPAQTQTLNDGSFEAFIPDKGNARMPFYFRQRINGQWHDWQYLAEIQLIE